MMLPENILGSYEKSNYPGPDQFGSLPTITVAYTPFTSKLENPWVDMTWKLSDTCPNPI